MSKGERRQRQDSGNDSIHDGVMPGNPPCMGSFREGGAVSCKTNRMDLSRYTCSWNCVDNEVTCLMMPSKLVERLNA